MTQLPQDCLDKAEDLMKNYSYLKAVHSTSGKEPYDRLVEDIAQALFQAREKAREEGFNSGVISEGKATKEIIAFYELSAVQECVRAIEPYSAKYRRYLKDAKTRNDPEEMVEFAHKDNAADEMLTALKSIEARMREGEPAV